MTMALSPPLELIWGQWIWVSQFVHEVGRDEVLLCRWLVGQEERPNPIECCHSVSREV